MAAKLILAFACITACYASPVLFKGYLIRDGRAFSLGQAFADGYGGHATGSATINGGQLQASSIASSNNQYDQNVGYGQVFPGQAVANAEAFNSPQAPEYGSANAVAQAQNMPLFYAVPAPATIVSYEQNFEAPAPINRAESSAVSNGNYKTSITSAKTVGSGSATSYVLNGVGSYGITSSNALSHGLGSASSTANNAIGSTNTATQTHGYGSASSLAQNGQGQSTSTSQSNGGYGSASSSTNNLLDSAVSTANTQGFGSASSNANIVNPGSGVSFAKTSQKGIRWQFGTALTPVAHAQAASNTHGNSFANANALNSGGYVNSVANTNGIGYGSAQSTANNDYGFAKSSALTNDYGAADANVIGNGSSQSNANVYGSRTSANAQSSGQGSASSSARTQGVNASYRVVNSSANSYGYGSAQSQAQSA